MQSDKPNPAKKSCQVPREKSDSNPKQKTKSKSVPEGSKKSSESSKHSGSKTATFMKEQASKDVTQKPKEKVLPSRVGRVHTFCE